MDFAPVNLALRLGAIVLAAGFGSGAMAAPVPTTRLVTCGDQACLMVRGHRGQREDTVAINGHRVAVEGGRDWRLRLPMTTLRAWSAPYARSLAIATGESAEREVSLPIGLLGHTTDLAALEVRIR
ncbi:hypothetical protein FHW96_003618 [Novosphingobium sp. SG751A]|uniref:hypothetical protein n=1 Tax=Novosphingobium sp. SG751A TaxID=2587000 RepID=UPI00155177B9|nr:hypothetical protein [Novosphingobium sp. SG751A]NOW47438.1 hypothetical protein [Novosphingobium sp. SG751A]